MTSASVTVERPFEVGAHDQRGDLRCLHVEGPLTMPTARHVRDLIAARVADGAGGSLLVDLEGVTAVDAAGVAALLEGQRMIDRATHGPMLLRANAVVIHALRATGTIGAVRVWTG